MASEKSKILVVGATGYLGRHVVAASARLGHPTLALVRDTAPSDAAKAALLKSFQDAGVTLLKGDLGDHASLVSAVKAADVVISTVGVRQIADQTRLINAIKETGNVKRFFPSEFGLDADRSGAVEPIRSLIINPKAAVRRAVEAAGVPYTYAWTGYFFGYGLPGIGQVLSQSPPVDKPAVVLGEGGSKVSYVDEGDIGTYTVMAADDPRAENRTLYIRPPANTLSHNELLAVWERKTGRAFERVHLDEDAVLKQIQEDPIPLNSILLSIGHAVHIKGEHEFEIDPSSGVDASELYPDVKYTTVDEYLNRWL
ncbi:hypothetical protein SEVIR_5G069500v4 [Setaria viridis]|uniref:NmrA-like domain-containing protein n=2 Tax=Setaria viridis TaxID=4556 RepID=A0A4U6UB36_SETVI|nr:isoflavone reductase homolog IRL-like [Setaria viridis]TKW12958.1 hypothetical protein SEVIR_5G069500v2 [Setaria viridis]